MFLIEQGFYSETPSGCPLMLAEISAKPPKVVWSDSRGRLYRTSQEAQIVLKFWQGLRFFQTSTLAGSRVVSTLTSRKVSQC